MHLRTQLLLASSTAALLAVRAHAQGADDCSAATPITGTGAFAVSTLGATDSAQQAGACVPAHADVWFRWTAPQSGSVLVRTCGGASVDTVLAAWNGPACPAPGTELACNDDTCGVQSSIAFAATAGSTYLLQLGAYGAAVTYTGTFSIEFPGASGNDACAAPQAITGPGPFPFDNTLATTGAEGQANPLCGSPAGIDRDLWFQWTATGSTPTVVSLCGGAGFDTKVAVYDGAGCPAGPAIACNDDSCGLQSQAFFNSVAGHVYTVQLGSWPTAAPGAGTFTIVPGSGGCPSPSVGPDVIVGDIVGVFDAPASGGLDAFAVGTGACNVGDVPLDWFAATNHHPVVGTNLYRYKVVGGAGRFEQVGLSWLKHGFGAATENLCCTCQNPGNSQLLGVGCADTYSAALNATQGPLGPRWQVDAHTGVFAYPPASPPWSGSTARRCEVALADLEATGGATRYFVECVYVTPEDAAAGNQDNNASHRELSVSGGPADFTFATLGATVRTRAAIEGWPVIDPAVRLATVRVPGEGLLFVASRATSLPGGLWHYEYAVENLNSDRAVGRFSIPIPSTAAVSQIGFHDVTYRNGDGPGDVNIDGADWSATLAGGVLTWATATHAQDPGANALRWGSAFNFRFDCDVAPASGVITLGLWKAGTPDAVGAAGDVPGGSMTPFCLGDGTQGACPCANSGAGGHGCANSIFAAGALLAGSGSASVAADTAVLTATNVTGTAAVFFQGSAAVAPVVIDDGLGCVGGTIVRLGTKPVAGASSSYPQAGDPSISVRGALPPAGGTFHYQCFYRNAAAAFCPPATSNRSQGVAVAWSP